MSDNPTGHSAPPLAAEVTIDLVAGRHPNGETIVERLLVNPLKTQATFQLLRSPVFVRGIARGDVIQQLQKPQGAFKMVQHGGNLCIRVFSKMPFDSDRLEPLAQGLTAEIEKLGGDLDVSEPQVRVYSIHVSCGFAAVEKILESQLAGCDDVAWVYGNVYDPETGEPLNWWQAILSPE